MWLCICLCVFYIILCDYLKFNICLVNFKIIVGMDTSDERLQVWEICNC